MAAITVRRNLFLLPSKPIFSLLGLYHKLVEAADAKPPPLTEDDYLIFKPGEVDVSKWKKVDSRSLGISRSMVPPSPYTALKILRTSGFEAYLVGGCVRDMLLNRTPKGFDIITTATLNQISEQFHRCEVSWLLFPVCRVFIKGSIVEVTSFDTLVKDSEGKEKFLVSHMPKGSDKLDLIRWKNSMHRDFTINSMFFDPFLDKIYDYNDGMKDLLELKLRTVVPAQLSFTEDPARMLRGLRIAACHGLSLAKEIKSAILKQKSSISQISQSRIMVELNSMLSFGAAESSLSMLHKYHLLEILLPFQAAYISQQSTRSGQSSMMLMKLLSHLDKLVSCDRPSGIRLWVGLLGFHLALVKNPQHPLVVLTFASVLYHQSWVDGRIFARKYSGTSGKFEPETLDPYPLISEVEVAEKVNDLAMLVIDSIDVLVDTESLHNAMAMFPGFSCSGLAFIPRKIGLYNKQLFHILAHKVETYRKGRSSYEINYVLLKKGDSLETRFTLGKIILNTMGCGVDRDNNLSEVNHHVPSYPETEHFVHRKEDTKQPQLPTKLHLQDVQNDDLRNMVLNTVSCVDDRDRDSLEINHHVPFNLKIEDLANRRANRKQSLLPVNLNLQLDSAHKKQKIVAKLSSIMQQRPQNNEYQVKQDYHQETSSTKHTEVVGVLSDPKNEDHKSNKPQIGTFESQMHVRIRMLEAVIDNEKSEDRKSKSGRETGGKDRSQSR